MHYDVAPYIYSSIQIWYYEDDYCVVRKKSILSHYFVTFVPRIIKNYLSHYIILEDKLH